MKRRLLLIVNSKAGRMKLKQELFNIIDLFCKNDCETVVYTTSKEGDGSAIVKENAGRFDVIICCGGDGTLNEMISGTMELDETPVLGYIPAGTTNDFARSIKLPLNIKAAAEKVIFGEVRSLDIGRFNDKYFSYIASFGAFTETSYKTSQAFKNAFGHFAYILEGIKEIPNISSYHLVVATENETYEDDFIFGAVSNSTSIAGILKLDEDIVDFSDGLFELMLIRKPNNPIELSKIISSLSKQDYDNDLFVFVQTSHIEINVDREMSWTLDGEYANGGNKIVIDNIPNGFKLIT